MNATLATGDGVREAVAAKGGVPVLVALLLVWLLPLLLYLTRRLQLELAQGFEAWVDHQLGHFDSARFAAAAAAAAAARVCLWWVRHPLRWHPCQQHMQQRVRCGVRAGQAHANEVVGGDNAMRCIHSS